MISYKLSLLSKDVVFVKYSVFSFPFTKTAINIDKWRLLKDVESQANDLQSTRLESLSVLLCSLTNHVKWHFVKFRNNIIFVKKVFSFFDKWLPIKTFWRSLSSKLFFLGICKRNVTLKHFLYF